MTKPMPTRYPGRVPLNAIEAKSARRVPARTDYGRFASPNQARWQTGQEVALKGLGALGQTSEFQSVAQAVISQYPVIQDMLAGKSFSGASGLASAFSQAIDERISRLRQAMDEKAQLEEELKACRKELEQTRLQTEEEQARQEEQKATETAVTTEEKSIQQQTSYQAPVDQQAPSGGQQAPSPSPAPAGGDMSAQIQRAVQSALEARGADRPASMPPEARVEAGSKKKKSKLDLKALAKVAGAAAPLVFGFGPLTIAAAAAPWLMGGDSA